MVCFVIERDRHVLLLRRSARKEEAPGQWETGSGRVEPGESPEEAARREAREETGLAVDVIAPLDRRQFLRGPTREETTSIVFHCRAGAGPLVLSAEHDHARWVPIAELSTVADVPEWVARSLDLLRRVAPS